jgi:hypothetical protein
MPVASSCGCDDGCVAPPKPVRVAKMSGQVSAELACSSSGLLIPSDARDYRLGLLACRVSRMHSAGLDLCDMDESQRAGNVSRDVSWQPYDGGTSKPARTLMNV